MLFSRSTEYAIRAMTFLATLPPGRLAGAREISEAEGIPIPFLWKILQSLARRKLIRSFKGLHGGYELARPSNQITIDMLLEVIDTKERFDSCLLGLPRCSDENACPLHETWRELRSRMTNMLQENTLADLARISEARTARLKTRESQPCS
jgi:Rrf2 family transcriptional regulator, iron-sulfur cluster assembly transcription factor